MFSLAVNMQRVIASRTAAARGIASRRSIAVRCSAKGQESASQLPKRVAAALAGVALTASLVVGPSLPAAAFFGYESPEQQAEEKKEIEREEKMLEYILQQQAIAKQAKIAAERQTLQSELSKAEETLQKKLTEEQANLDAVIAKGDTKAAEAIGAEQQVIAEREQQLVTAAAVVEAKIDREEMLAKAEKIAAEQALEKQVTIATEVIDSTPVAEAPAAEPTPVPVAARIPEPTSAPLIEEAPTLVPAPAAPTPAPEPALVAEAAPEAAPVSTVAEVPAPPVAETPAPKAMDADSINSAIDSFLAGF